MMKVGGELAGVNDPEAEFLSITIVRSANSVQLLKSSQRRVWLSQTLKTVNTLQFL